MALAGSYADRADFVRFYSEIEGVELSNFDDPTAQFINSEQMDAALIAATGYVNSKIAARYPTPLTSWDQQVVQVVCAIAVHNNLDQFTIREATEKRCKFSIAWLDEIQEGTAILLDADSIPIPERSQKLNAPRFSLGCI